MTPARAVLESLLNLCSVQRCISAIESFSNEPVGPALKGGAASHTIGEVDLLRHVLQKDILKKISELGSLGHFLTSTLLRHRATQIHSMWLINRFHKMTVSLPKSLVTYWDSWEFESNHQDLSWGLGFSPVGFQKIQRPLNTCSAFDLYDCNHCQQEVSEHVYCQEHQKSHSWWDINFRSQWCVQSTMFAFYANPNAIDSYSQHELDNLLNNFFYQLKQWPHPIEYENALRYFGLQSVEDYKSKGQLWLRRKYREMARQCHPDSGGNHEAFCILEDNYTCLLRMSL